MIRWWRDGLAEERTSPEWRKPKRRRIAEQLAAYLERWQRARQRRVDKAIADMLGHAREHTAIVEVHPRHAGSMLATSWSPWLGIARSVAPSLQHVQEPFSFATLREAVAQVLAYQPPPPVKPALSRERAEVLIAGGVSRQLLESAFDVY